MEPLQFDIPAIVQQKAPNAHIPGFVLRYLERITHVEQMNRFLRNNPDLHGYEFIRKVVAEELNCTASIHGVENIPETDRPVIFVGNHPLGGLDGMIIAEMIHAHRPLPLRVIVNDLLMFMRPIAELWVPISKLGGQSREYARLYQEAWEKEQDMLTFPAGACSRRQKIDGRWQIRDLEWQKSFVQKAQQLKRDVVPIYFEGHNSPFFYRLQPAPGQRRTPQTPGYQTEYRNAIPGGRDVRSQRTALHRTRPTAYTIYHFRRVTHPERVG